MCKEIVEQARLKRDAETSKQWYLMIQEADAKLAAREFDEAEPLYQANYPIPNDPNHDRGIPDVAYDGDPLHED